MTEHSAAIQAAIVYAAGSPYLVSPMSPTVMRQVLEEYEELQKKLKAVETALAKRGAPRDENGRIIKAEDLSKEQLLDLVARLREYNATERAASSGSVEALRKRCQSHAKARTLANRRADVAEKALREVTDTFASALKSMGASE